MKLATQIPYSTKVKAKEKKTSHYFMYPGIAETVEVIVSVDDIIDYVFRFMGVLKALLETKSRKRDLAKSKQIIAWILNRRTSLSLQEIAIRVRAKTHPSVLHSCKTINNLIDINDIYGQKATKILEELDAIAKTKIYDMSNM